MRIDEAVIRGWIDNTTPGETRGGLELVGVERPIQMILRGNCRRDLAGTRLDFVNPSPQVQKDLLGKVYGLHRGVVGEMTASRRVKVPLISSEEFESYLEKHEEIPFAWQNGIYLEWFSLTNGRIVIEAQNFELKLSGHHWELDEKGDALQKLENEQVIEHFIELIGHANEAESQLRTDTLAEADEYEWERRLRVKDSLEETAMFLNAYEDVYGDELDEKMDDLEEEKMKGRFGLVRRSFRLQNEVMSHLGNSYLDDGARSELSLSVAYIFSVLDEAWPVNEIELEVGYRLAVLKRAIDASVAAISACNTLEMEDDAYGALRGDVFVIRDEMISLKRHLREQHGLENGDKEE